jgi:hypothetical protein
MRGVVLLAALLVAAAPLGGCTTTRETGRAPGLEPPPARPGEALTREQALEIARGEDLELAIRLLDERRFAFVLDAAAIGWFERGGATPEAVDYLRKRCRVDWEGLRGDVDPDAPERAYVDPRRGFDDWAGFGRRESFTSPRSRDPFAH